MYSSEDLERFYFQYKTEAVPKGMSIEQFCLNNKVPYNIFIKWYRDTRKKIVEVQVDGRPSSPTTQSLDPEDSFEGAQKGSTSLRILVEVRMTNGLRISQRNLSYQELKQLIEKLEVLC